MSTNLIAIAPSAMLRALAIAMALVVAACGGGEWDCPQPAPPAEGKKAIPADTCREADL